jgi:hypothetical protein
MGGPALSRKYFCTTPVQACLLPAKSGAPIPFTFAEITQWEAKNTHLAILLPTFFYIL